MFFFSHQSPSLFALNHQNSPQQSNPELAVQTGHIGSVVCIDWSPDEKYVATLGSTSDQDGTVKVWRAKEGQLVADIGIKRFTSFAWSPYGEYMALSSEDETLIWHTKSGKFLTELGQSHAADEILWSPKGKYLTTLTKQGVSVWDSQSWQLQTQLDVNRGAIGPMSWSPNGKYLVTSSLIWEMPSGQAVAWLQNFKRQAMGINPITWSPDGRYLAAGNGNHLKIWEVHTGQIVFQTENISKIKAIDWSPDGRYIAVGSLTGLVYEVMQDQNVKQDRLTVSFLRELKGHTSWIESVKWSPNGKYLATGSNDATVRIWSSSHWNLVTELNGHSKEILSIAWSPSGAYLATAGADNTSIIWKPEIGQIISELKGQIGRQLAVCWSPDAKLIAMGGRGSPVRVWEVESGQVITVLKTLKQIDAAIIEVWKIPAFAEVLSKPTSTINIHSLSWSPDSKQLAVLSTNGKGLIEMWEPRDGTLIDKWEVDQKNINAISWSPDGHYLATGGTTNKDNETGTKIWEVSTGRLVAETDHQENEERVTVKTLSWSPDGEYLARGGINISPGVWKFRNNRMVKPFMRGRCVAWSDDGQFLAIGDNIWDNDSQEFISELKRNTYETKITGVSLTQFFSALRYDTKQLSSLTFSPDGRYLASSNGLAVRVWDQSSGQQLAILAGHTGIVSHLDWSPDGRFLITASQDGTAKLWTPLTGELQATLIPIGEERDWLINTPDGFFDGSPAAFKLVGWHNDKLNYLNVDPVEIYFNEYYYPSLLSDILAGKRPTAKKSISQLDRRQPQVKITLINEPDLAGKISSRTVNVRIEVAEAPADQRHSMGSGARDLRLFRNGSLIKVWRGNLLKNNKRGCATLETTIPIIYGGNHLTAYAFNRDNIKSRDATLIVTGAENLKRPSTAYILTIGINLYENSDYNLNYAVRDATSFAEELLQQMNQIGTFSGIKIISLIDQDATKENILGVLTRMSGLEMGEAHLGASYPLENIKSIEPEDAVFIFYAGHGTAYGSQFYLIPYNLGYQGPREELSENTLSSILTHSISDLELEQAFELIDANHLLLVIDACNSGQALNAEEKRRGPMNSKGLAQLAYEKGMYILTAAQGYQAALEAKQLNHGLLTYVLVEEGLKTPLADLTPQDGQIVVREWLDFATIRVPQLQMELMQHSRSLGQELAFVDGEKSISVLSKRSLQRPRVFYRRVPALYPLVVAKHH